MLLMDEIWDAPGLRKNATLENNKAGVNREMLIWLITWISDQQDETKVERKTNALGGLIDDTAPGEYVTCET